MVNLGLFTCVERRGVLDPRWVLVELKNVIYLIGELFKDPFQICLQILPKLLEEEIAFIPHSKALYDRFSKYGS